MQKTNPTTNETRKEGLKSYADMTIYEARLVPKICHHKLPTTIVTSLTLRDISLSLQWLKCMQLAHACPIKSSIHLVLVSNLISCCWDKWSGCIL